MVTACTRAFRAITLAAALSTVGSVAQAQSNPRYIQFQPSPTKGALYVPDSGPAPTVAFLVIHRTSNFMNHISTRELARRGFMVLGMNTRFDNNEAIVRFEQMALDVKQGIEFLRKQNGIQRVILIGHSGGGPTTTFYQAVAEKGVSYCQGKNKLTECGKELENLPKADAMVLLDAHPGNTVNALRSLNPAVRNEARPWDIDPKLDAFNPRNGWNASGHSTYTKEFMDRYFKGQADRMNRLIAQAQKMRADMDAGKRLPKDDAPFIAYRNRARMSDFSMSVAGETSKPVKHLKNDGKIVTEVVKSVRVALVDNKDADQDFNRGTLAVNVRTFLSNNSIRATHSQDGIDWCSSNNSAPCALRSISVPVVIYAMSGHYFIRDGEVMLENAASKDKDYIIVEGANHSMVPCQPCAKAQNKDYGNATRNLFDNIAAWTKQRFAAAPAAK